MWHHFNEYFLHDSVHQIYWIFMTHDLLILLVYAIPNFFFFFSTVTNTFNQKRVKLKLKVLLVFITMPNLKYKLDVWNPCIYLKNCNYKCIYHCVNYALHQALQCIWLSLTLFREYMFMYSGVLSTSQYQPKLHVLILSLIEYFYTKHNKLTATCNPKGTLFYQPHQIFCKDPVLVLSTSSHTLYQIPVIIHHFKNVFINRQVKMEIFMSWSVCNLCYMTVRIRIDLAFCVSLWASHPGSF